MGKLIEWLKGKKTYIMAGALVLVQAVESYDQAIHGGQSLWLSTEVYAALKVAAGGGGLIFLRSAVAKS